MLPAVKKNMTARSKTCYNHGMGKAEENKKAKREALLSTAFDLFTAQGFPATSIANIAEKAGVAKGTFYLYFKDKYDLRDRLIRAKATEILTTAFKAMDRTASRTLEDQILFLASNIIGQLAADKSLLRFIGKNLSWSVLKHNMETITPFEGRDDTMIDMIQDAFATSKVQYKEPEVMIYMIVEFVGSSCYSAVLESDPLPIQQLRPYILDAVRAIIRSQEI